MVICFFDDSNKVSGVGVILKSVYTEELAKFLAKRYVMVKETGNITLIGFDHLDEDKATLGVAVSLYDASY